MNVALVLLAAKLLDARSCSSCHPAEAKEQPATSMSHALAPASSAVLLAANPQLSFQSGIYSYTIRTQGGESIYKVSDGKSELSVPLAWAFGLGSAGQTYVFERDGELYETRVSYYRELHGLDLTLGASNSQPNTLLEAAGEIINRNDTARCFGCHATNAFEGRRLNLDRMTAGVQCERCHGDSTAHLAGLKPMRHLAALTTEETSNFCGQCHRTWAEIAAGGTHGVVNVRFQPFGLTNSKCYDTEDKRISCVGCHNPHLEVDHNVLDYDAHCQSCHARTGKANAKVCRVGVQACVTCHMPKTDLPGSHHKFTDHEIRIVRTSAEVVK